MSEKSYFSVSGKNDRFLFKLSKITISNKTFTSCLIKKGFFVNSVESVTKLIKILHQLGRYKKVLRVQCTNMTKILIKKNFHVKHRTQL